MLSSLHRRKLFVAGAFLALVLLFLVADRAAYKGYFSDDDLDTLSWIRSTDAGTFVTALVSLRPGVSNFRPAGHFYYWVMNQLAALHFPWYVAAIQSLHLTVVVLVYTLARKLKFDCRPALASAVFFAFHGGVFDIYWKPMYVFDLLCGLFSILCLLAYTHGKYVLSLLAFWLAFKSKEVAIMLPAVLACYELWLGQKRWKWLAPYFLISLSFGVQALIHSHGSDTSYTFRFSIQDIATCIDFYSTKLFLVPYAGLAILALPLLIRDRRLYFGVSAFCLLLVPMLLLPGRLFGAYLYVPLLGAAIAFASVASRAPMPVLAAFFMLWIPWNYYELRLYRRETLTVADQTRAYMTAIFNLKSAYPDLKNFVYDEKPSEMGPYGIEGAVHLAYPGSSGRIRSFEDAQTHKFEKSERFAIISWDPFLRRVRTFVGGPDQVVSSYVSMDRDTPIWQLEEGWLTGEWHFRWARPYARARLLRPAGAIQFELAANIAPLYLEKVKRCSVTVFVDGEQIGQQEFTRTGWQIVHWNLRAAPSGTVEVEFRTEPALHLSQDDVRGLPVGGFGFLSPAR